jgi:hypothetical protein
MTSSPNVLLRSTVVAGALLLLVGATAVSHAASANGDSDGHGVSSQSLAPQVPAPASAATCIPAEARKKAEQGVSEFHRKFGYRPASPEKSGGAGLEKYTFHPQAGILGQDIFMNNYVDLDQATTGILDYACSDVTYDGHQGHDCEIVDFTRQGLGVPVFAALDGTVAGTHDGEVDTNTVWANQPANYVILYHGGTHYTWYWHFKKNSVQVTMGQTVKAGQQLGLTGSSGNSSGPHLHFESRDSGTFFEPEAGNCRSGQSNWVSQPAHSTDSPMYAKEFTVTQDNLSTWTGPLTSTSHTGSIAPGQQVIWFWLLVHNMPANSTWRVKILNPSSVAVSDSTGAATTGFARDTWWWWSRNVNFNVTGTWRIQVSFSGTQVVDAPLVVTNSPANRAPSAATVAITPAAPTVSDVLICRVTNWTVIDDPDYDVVRYHYVWTVNGSTARDVVTAALSDVFPHQTAPAGATVQCTVTPSDGNLSAAPATATATLVGPASVDTDWSVYQ